jgi:hypothetical protein
MESEWMQVQDPEKVEGMRQSLVAKDWTVAGRNWLDMASGDESYAMWLFLCDRRMGRMVGVGIFDIEDWTWADAYGWGASPSEACREALESSDTYGLLMGGE